MSDSSNISEDIELLSRSLDKIYGESKRVYQYLNRLQGVSLSNSKSFLTKSQDYMNNEEKRMKHLKEVYTKFESDVNVEYTAYLNTLHQVYDQSSKEKELLNENDTSSESLHELRSYITHEQERLTIKNEANTTFYNSLDKIIKEYYNELSKIEKEGKLEYFHLQASFFSIQQELQTKQSILLKKEEIISNADPKFIYKDGIVSKKLDIELIKKYPSSYYYNEYNSNRRTESGDIYIDHDSENEDSLVKYMKEDKSLIDDINNMSFKERFNFLQNLDFFTLPVKIEYLNILSFNEDNKIMESWRNNKMIIVNDKWLESISDELRKNGKMEKMYNGKLLNEIRYDKNSNHFGIDVEMKCSDIIENYLNNGRKWEWKTLILKGLKIEDIINEMTMFGVDLNDDEKKALEENWINVRYVFVNGSYKQSIDNYLKKDHSFITIYLNNMNNEDINNDGLLFVNINMNNADVIEKYLNNGKEWRKDDLFTRGLRYSDILNDLKTIGLRLNEEDKNKLKLEWMKSREIWVNDDYKRSINRYLRSNDKFVEIYENNISNEKHDDYDDTLYVNIKLKYDDIISDYIAHDQHLNINILKRIYDYKYDDLNKELQLLGIKLSDNEIIKLKELSVFSFSSISKILNIEYDKYLNEWLGYKYDWKCIYRASEHGYTAQSFHDYCDNIGPTLIIIKSHNDYIFGGYTTQSWGGDRIVIKDENSFLFTLKNAHNIGPTKYNAINDGSINAVSNWGPTLGGNGKCDLKINDKGKNCNEEDSCYIWNDGTNGYECDPQYKMSLFVNTNTPENANSFSVSDYEVFAITGSTICSVL